MAQTIKGSCHICCQAGMLTFEHVPPRKAFNKDRAEHFGIESWLTQGDTGAVGPGRIQQRGSGDHTLCVACNVRTGRWYVPEFVRWTRQGAEILSQLSNPEVAERDPKPKGARVRFSGVNRLRVLKQIVTMFFSINGPDFAAHHPDLVAFVMERRRTGVPSRYRFYVSLYRGPLARFVGLATRINMETRQAAYLTEIAYPPFAYLLTVDTAPGHLPLGDVSDFANAPDRRDDLELDLLVAFGHTPYPADYRSRAAVEGEAGLPLPTIRRRLRRRGGR
jgi:hypothetical protein